MYDDSISHDFISNDCISSCCIFNDCISHWCLKIIVPGGYQFWHGIPKGRSRRMFVTYK